MGQTDKGKFTPKNPQKMIDGQTNVTFRSSWELSVMLLLDSHPSVEAWGSECVQVPYKHPIRGKWTVYMPDFVVVFSDRDGSKHVEMWEVKPLKECAGYVAGKTKSGRKAVISEATKMKQAVNGYKWAAARHYCHTRGWNFRVLTERELFGFKPAPKSRAKK